MNLHYIEPPNTKWLFVNFSNIDLKVVLDRQPLSGTGPLLAWLLPNLANSCTMVVLDIFYDNLCVWRCRIAVHKGVHPDRSTQVAGELAKSCFKIRATPNNILKTSLDELDKVESYLNQELLLADWLGIRVYEPGHQENGEILGHFRKNLSDKLVDLK